MSLNKVIVIIGASSGIGANLARYLSNDAKIHLNKIGLVLIARRENELNQIGNHIQNEYCCLDKVNEKQDQLQPLYPIHVWPASSSYISMSLKYCSH